MRTAYHDLTTESILAEVERIRWDCAECASDPTSWAPAEQTLDFLLLQLDDAFAELHRRERLASSLYAPAWPDSAAELAAIKERMPLVDFIEEHGGVTLHGKNKRRRGTCPFHDDTTPSLSVDPTQGLWHCFGCGRGGDIFTFAQEMLGGGEFGDAVDLVAAAAGIARKPRTPNLLIGGKTVAQWRAALSPLAITSIPSFPIPLGVCSGRNRQKPQPPRFEYAGGKVVAR